MMACPVEFQNEPDVNGQIHPIETPELVAFKLRELQQELDSLPLEQTVHVRQAQAECPELLTEEFLLLFLRCDVFKAKLAARRYAKYWKKRVEIFGPEKAFQPLLLDGTVADVIDVIEMGVVTPIINDPSSGRRSIVYMYPKNFDKSVYTVPTFLRAFFYLMHVLLENEETAKKGLIAIDFQDSISLAAADKNIALALQDCFKSAIPIRLSAYHICQPAPFMALLWPLVKFIFGRHLLKRMHLHHGTPETVLNALRQHGLPDADIPEILGGEREIDIKKWVTQRRQYEQTLDHLPQPQGIPSENQLVHDPVDR